MQGDIMRIILIALLTLTVASQVVAEEYWACDGFTSARGSGAERFDPFLMKGNEKTGYAFKGITGSPKTIKYVASNEGKNYNIYIGHTKEIYGKIYDDNMKNVFYMKPQDDGTILFYSIDYDSYLKDTFNGGILAFVTKCSQQ